MKTKSQNQHPAAFFAGLHCRRARDHVGWNFLATEDSLGLSWFKPYLELRVKGSGFRALEIGSAGLSKYTYNPYKPRHIPKYRHY